MSEYRTTTRWTLGRAGIANAETAEQAFSAPVEFQGQPDMWTPEHFLMAAVAGCFVTTLISIAELSKFGVVSLEVSAVGDLEKGERGFQFTRAVIRPVLTIAEEGDRQRAVRLIEKTERSCLVARSLRSEVRVETNVLVQVPVAV